MNEVNRRRKDQTHKVVIDKELECNFLAIGQPFTIYSLIKDSLWVA